MKKKVLAIAGVSAGVALVTTLGIISIVKKVRKAKREKDFFGREFGGSVFDTPNDSFSSPCSEKICRNNFLKKGNQKSLLETKENERAFFIPEHPEKSPLFGTYISKCLNIFFAPFLSSLYPSTGFWNIVSEDICFAPPIPPWVPFACLR